MKHLPTIAGALLGLLFIFAGVMVLFKLAPAPDLPKDTPLYFFMTAFSTTGYLTFVKVLEVLGGLLVALPKTRNLGLLVLRPIIVNILACHLFIMKGEGLLNPMLIFICVAALFLLWVERKAFAGLLHRPSVSAQ